MSDTLTPTPPSPSPSPSTAASASTSGGDGPLAGRVALVTGASSGIGAAVARRFAEAGARVGAVARREDRLAALGDGVVPLPADVTDPAAVAAAVDRAVRDLGAPDLVVANAGVMLPSPSDEARLDVWQRNIDVNVTGVAATVAAVVPHLVAAAAEGRTADLVLVSSIGDALAFPGYAAYTASKAWVTKFSHDLRFDLAPLGVRTLNVRPGLVVTELMEKVGEGVYRESLDEMAATMGPLSADDVAGTVLAAVALPRHVNVSELAIVPTGQPAPV
ncbi:MAG TPA: SDR family oxidoreductase [Acidimicrobiales bacterium]